MRLQQLQNRLQNILGKRQQQSTFPYAAHKTSQLVSIVTIFVHLFDRFVSYCSPKAQVGKPSYIPFIFPPQWDIPGYKTVTDLKTSCELPQLRKS